MRSIAGLTEAASVFILSVVAVGGFVPPSAYQHHRQHHAHLVVPPPSSQPGPASFRSSSSRTACAQPLRMNKAGGDSQEPASRGVDTEGIDARGGPDTEGIYGFAREIVEKEEAQAPFRRLRLIGYAVPAFIAIFLAGVSLAGTAGLDEFKEVSENLPNPLVDAGVVGCAFYLWVEEVKTKRSSLALLKKEYEENSKPVNRSARRQKKAFGKRKKAPGMTNAATKQPQPAAPAPEAEKAEAPAAPAKKGMFDGVKETLDAVNKRSYYQALALNKELEEKGVLPPLERKPAPPPGGGGGSGGGDQEGVVAVPEDKQEPELATAGVADGKKAAAAVASQGGGGSKRPRKKGKGGKKGKRGK